MTSIPVFARYADFYRLTREFLAAERPLFLLFVSLSLLAAFTEGLGLALFVPILQPDGREGFARIPVLGHLVTWFVGGSEVDRFQRIALVLALVVIVRGAVSFASRQTGSTIPLRLHRHLAMRCYDALMTMGMSHLHDIDVGTLKTHIGAQCGRVAMLLRGVGNIIANLLLIIVYALLMLAVSWQLTLISMVFVVAILFLLRLTTNTRLHAIGKDISRTQAHINHVVLQTVFGMKAIRYAVAEDFMRRRFTAALTDLIEAMRRQAIPSSANNPLFESAAGLFLCVLLIIGAVLYTDTGGGWINRLVLFLIILYRLLAPATNLNQARFVIAGNYDALVRLSTFLDAETKNRQPTGAAPFDGLRSEIRLENLTFTYPHRDRPAVAGVSLLIPKGKMIGICGPSGSGKSTLVGLLLRLYDPQGGGIRVDGQDLKNLDIYTWRRRVGVVSQDAILFDASATDNIAFGIETPDIAAVRRAAHLAAADEFIAAMPRGYNTLLGDRGLRLSGGQQQRIAIARAILRQPDVLIFDEATSHLDTATERRIQQAIDGLRQDRTVLVIAHRLSTIRNADTIIAMEDGRIVEQGTHEDLVALGGLYARLLAEQAAETKTERPTKA